VKPTSLTIAPKLGILVGTAMCGLCLASALIAYLTLREMPSFGMLGLAIAAVAVSSGCIAWVMARGFSVSLTQLVARTRALADGEVDADIPGLERGDEIAAMAASVQMFKESAVRMRGIGNVDTETQGRALAERRTAMETLANEFERSVNGIVRSVTTAAAGMQTTAQSMTATASEASARAATVGAASESASNNVGTVAAAAEELSSSVAEISRQVTRSSEIASKAVGDAERTNATVQVLSTGARKSERWSN